MSLHLEFSYCYVIKIDKKIWKKNKKEFRDINLLQHKNDKGIPNSLNKGQSKYTLPQGS